LANAKVALTIFSNPAETDRLRLDKEHRAIDDALVRAGYGRDAITRLHATQIDDIVTALREAHYEILQFSGHGTTEGFVLERDGAPSLLLTAANLAGIIAAVCGRVRVVMAMACFSSASVNDLITTADYVIAANGPLGDNAATAFIKTFYECYIRKPAVEAAFAVAKRVSSASDECDLLLWKRDASGSATNSVLVAFPAASGTEAICVDICEATADIERLGLRESDVLRDLTRKLKVHRWIFAAPRDRVLLPLGRYIGMFSWRDESSVTCQRLMRISPSVSEASTEAFVALAITYQDLFVANYRTKSPYDPGLRQAIKMAINDHQLAGKHLFTDELSTPLRALAPDEFKLARAIVQQNVNVAERKFHNEMFGEAASHLEAALSAIHDLVEAASERIVV